jgi:hypothetical protein
LVCGAETASGCIARRVYGADLDVVNTSQTIRAQETISRKTVSFMCLSPFDFVNCSYLPISVIIRHIGREKSFIRVDESLRTSLSNVFGSFGNKIRHHD